MKNKEKKNRGLIKVRFSIGAKLITIISVIVILSLGSITALVSWMVQADLRIAAEENNFEANRRSAMEAENTLTAMRVNSLILMQAVTALRSSSPSPAREADPSENVQEITEFFFVQNPLVAALMLSADEFFINKRFFLLRGIDVSLAESYLKQRNASLLRAAAGETVLLNAASWFNSSLLALFFPGREGGGAVLFSPENLSDNFGFGTNQSYLINDSGDILIHADFGLLRSGANVAEKNFTQYIRNSQARNTQTLFTDEEGKRHFGAFTKLNTVGCTVITTIEYNKVFEGIAATTRRNIMLTGAVLSISIMLIWFFAKSISVPLKGLAAAAHTIEGGTFELDLRPKSRDEIGVLTDSFQRMCTALGIFGRFTNRDIAVRAMRGEINPGGLPKHATVFFSDIRDFTKKSENFTKLFGSQASDRIVFWLNEYLSRMVECVEKTGGVVDKFIGDAVMAHWGTAYTAGSPHKDAVNCITAALMMRTTLYQMNKTRNENDSGNPSIRIGCGINTGIVTAGQIGSDLRMEYTVIGDPVNLASRIEALNKPLGTDILISEDTWHMVKNHFIVEEMPSVSVKGKEKNVRIFAVVNFAGIDKGPKTLAEVRMLLGIKAPNMSKVNVNADEVKYSIGSTN